MRDMPHSPIHERALLSCVLQEPLVCGRAALDAFGDELPFHLPECALIWGAVQRIDLERVSVLTVSDYLGARLDLTAIRDVANTSPSIAMFDTHLSWVRKHHAQRKLIATLEEAQAHLYDEKANPDEITQALREGIGNAMTEGHKLANAEQSLAELDGMMKSDMLGSSTGYFRLDRVLAPMPRGSMIVLAARPKIGKTALSMGMALNLAVSGNPVGIISMEMPKAQLMARMVASVACVSSRLQDMKYVWNTEPVVRARAALATLPIYIEDGVSDWRKIKRVIRAMSAAKGIRHWWIDHIGLVTSDAGQKDNREREVAKISNDSKKLALELKGWIFVVSQLNRQAEGHMPQLHQLRESGSIEQDADAVIFLHRERDDSHEAFLHIVNGGMVECTAMVAAHRHGPTGPVTLPYYPKYSLFSNEAAKDEEIQA